MAAPWRRSSIAFAALFACVAACGVPAHGLDSGDDDDDDTFFSISPSTPTTPTCDEAGCPSVTPVCYGAAHFTPSCFAAPQYDPCTVDSDCAPPDATCYGLSSGSGHGICSRPQSAYTSSATGDDYGCGAGGAPGDELASVVAGHAPATGAPAAAICAPSCGNGVTCPASFACAAGTALSPTLVAESFHSCVAYCTTGAECPEGSCDGYTHRCGAVDATLQDNGAPCAMGSDCRGGRCDTTDAGFLDGLCVSRCIAPDPASLGAADCAAGDVCVAAVGAGPDEVGECRPPCTTSAECRPDYVCITRGNGGYCGIRSDPLEMAEASLSQ